MRVGVGRSLSLNVLQQCQYSMYANHYAHIYCDTVYVAKETLLYG